MGMLKITVNDGARIIAANDGERLSEVLAAQGIHLPAA